jgi:hypothetical protein
LIGQPKERFLQLKTKETVDHVGLSVQLVYYNHGPYLVVKLLIYPNSNWLTALNHTETKDAMEDLTIKA